MATVSKESYLRLVENRPYKFDSEEVNYRDSEGEEKCQTCAHFFERVVDQFHTCEIFRPVSDASVNPDYVCNFHTVGETTPEPSSTS